MHPPQTPNEFLHDDGKKNVCPYIAGIISSAFCGKTRATDSGPSWRTGEEKRKAKCNKPPSAEFNPIYKHL